MIVFAMAAVLALASEADDLIKAAQASLARGQFEEALIFARKAVELEPKKSAAHLAVGACHEAIAQNTEAAAAYGKAIELDPKSADALSRRGGVLFKLGKVKESVADFDRQIALKPDDAPGHWRRGISLYYVGKFEEGKKQFEGYEKVDTNDVENAVWHYLCNARLVGAAKASKELLKIGNDRRVPMMQVYRLFAGAMTPEDVMTAANEGTVSEAARKQRLFYAHLYLGLYQEVIGDKKRAAEHLGKAAGEYRIGHYMGDVARVHRDLLKDAK